MKAWLRKTAGAVASEPINHRRWQETVDDFDQTLEAAFDQESEEAVVDLWLEDPQSFREGLESSPTSEQEQVSPMRRVRTGGLGLQRYNPMARTASVNSFDQDFADAQEHVAQVLKNLGNGR